MTDTRKYAQAGLDSMYRIFTAPEAPSSTLGRLDQDISQNLIGFLQKHIVAEERDLVEIEQDFTETRISEEPIFVSEQAQFLLDKVVSQSVHTASPSFIGHMTTALPYFMLPLSKIMIGLNQNMVKTETSKAFTPLERQVLGIMHRLVYDRDDAFYTRWLHDSHQHLGAFCSGGTIANITALWAARNQAFGPSGSFKGITKEGLFKAFKHYGCEGAAILVSERGHYSLSKAADLLGIGREQLVAIETDNHNRIRPDAVRERIRALGRENIRVFALVGIAGTTETGNIDPLEQLADIAQEERIHFHVDAAWGGPILFSDKYRGLVKGIERADSVTIDAHKQLYVPMGVGLVVFKDPALLNSIEHHAQYIIRQGSKDLGSHTLEGSRPGMAMLLHSGLKIIGRKGYELLLNEGIEKAKTFAAMIQEEADFELITAPELNILTYRYVPSQVQPLLKQVPPALRDKANEILDRVTRTIQKVQRERGKAFVSRTRLSVENHGKRPITVFRVVLANPLTTHQVLKDVLDEQKQIAANGRLVQLIRELELLVEKAA
jgi:glutamate decarboxylase